MADRKNARNIGNEPGFVSPLGKPSSAGDAMDASPPETPVGPVPDPIGNISKVGTPHGPQDLPNK